MENKKTKKERVNDMVNDSQKIREILLAAVPDESYNASVAIACAQLFARFISAAATSKTSALAMVLDTIDLIKGDVEDWCEEFKKPIHTKIEDEKS